MALSRLDTGASPLPAPPTPVGIINQLPPSFQPGNQAPPPSIINQLPSSLLPGNQASGPGIVNQLSPTAKPTTGGPFSSDPGYQAALAQEQLGLSQNNAALNNQIAQRIIAYGDPALASMAGFGLDPQSAAFARQNYLSGNGQLARIDRQHKDNLQAIINQLASHGLLFSGDTGYRSGQEDQNYGNTVYDAQQAALADILGYRQSNLQQNQALHQSVIDALQNAYQTYLNHPELGGYGAPAAPAPKKTTAASTSAAQMASALKRYNQNQNRNLYG